MPVNISIWDPNITKMDLGKFGHMLTVSLENVKPNLLLISNNFSFHLDKGFVNFIRKLDSNVTVIDLWQLTEKISGIGAHIYQLGKSWIDESSRD